MSSRRKIAMSTLLGRAAESLRTEGPGGFSARATKYLLRLGKTDGSVVSIMPVSGHNGGVHTYNRSEYTPNDADMFAPVRDGIEQVETMLKSIRPMDFPFLATILDHILAPSGKRARPAIALLSGKLGVYNTGLLVPLATSIE